MFKLGKNIGLFWRLSRPENLPNVTIRLVGVEPTGWMDGGRQQNVVRLLRDSALVFG